MEVLKIEKSLSNKSDFIKDNTSTGDVIVVKDVNMMKMENGQFVCEYGRIFNTEDICDKAIVIVKRNGSLMKALLTGSTYKQL